MNEVKQSDDGIVPRKAANNRGASPGGDAGGKDVNQRESARPKHRPDAGPEYCATGGGADTAGSYEESEGETHSVTAPYNAGHTAMGLLLA